MEKFTIGDLVKLKSGSPMMTVEKVSVGQIHCRWFSNHTFDFHTSVFAPQILAPASAATKPKRPVSVKS